MGFWLDMPWCEGKRTLPLPVIAAKYHKSEFPSPRGASYSTVRRCTVATHRYRTRDPIEKQHDFYSAHSPPVYEPVNQNSLREAFELFWRAHRDCPKNRSFIDTTMVPVFSGLFHCGPGGDVSWDWSLGNENHHRGFSIDSAPGAAPAASNGLSRRSILMIIPYYSKCAPSNSDAGF